MDVHLIRFVPIEQNFTEKRHGNYLFSIQNHEIHQVSQEISSNQ